MDQGATIGEEKCLVVVSLRQASSGPSPGHPNFPNELSMADSGAWLGEISTVIPTSEDHYGYLGFGWVFGVVYIRGLRDCEKRIVPLFWVGFPLWGVD